jgi:thiol:disulfide interchange protein
MDRIDAGPASRARSQSRLPAALFWVVLAAAVFRVVTAVMDRPTGGDDGLVQWQPREQALDLARKSGKPILYDFSAAWCGPCKVLDREWAKPGVAERVNGAFIAARVIDRVREEGRNPEDIDQLQRRYGITGFPALVVAAPDGKMLGKLEGYGGPDRLQRFLQDPASEKAD